MAVPYLSPATASGWVGNVSRTSVEPGHDDDVPDQGLDAAQHGPAADLSRLLRGDEQNAQTGAGHVRRSRSCRGSASARPRSFGIRASWAVRAPTVSIFPASLTMRTSRRPETLRFALDCSPLSPATGSMRDLDLGRWLASGSVTVSASASKSVYGSPSIVTAAIRTLPGGQDVGRDPQDAVGEPPG